MPNNDKKKIKDYLNSPDTELLEVIYNQFDTPNADLAKWTLNYRLYENMVRLNKVIEDNNKKSIRYNRYMFWLASFMALIAFFNLLLISISFYL